MLGKAAAGVSEFTNTKLDLLLNPVSNERGSTDDALEYRSSRALVLSDIASADVLPPHGLMFRLGKAESTETSTPVGMRRTAIKLTITMLLSCWYDHTGVFVVRRQSSCPPTNLSVSIDFVSVLEAIADTGATTITPYICPGP